MVLRFFLLASVFFFASCVSIERNNPDDPGSDNYVGESEPRSSNSVLVSSSSVVSIVPSSSSAVPSSSSSVPSSSSDNIIYGTPVDYEGETYKTVVIGSQTWMARNLNYNAPGSKCYDNQDSYCKTYGRLYDWATAMNIEAGYNNESWNGDYENHKGICPDGWHIPSEEDWNTLIQSVGEDNLVNVSHPLNAISGWGNYFITNGSTRSGNGTDIYGFSALPGGCYSSYCGDNIHFCGVPTSGFWWSANESVDPNNLKRNARNMRIAPRAALEEYNKISLFSVRCVMDSPSTPSSSSSVLSSSSAAVPSSSSKPSSSSSIASSSSSQQTGTIPGPSVSYDGETYESVVIGKQTWMARNLNYTASGSKCNGDDPANCSKYGRLYNWATAMALPNCGYGTSCGSQIGANHRGICPPSWHIPSDAEWTTLTAFVGSSTAGKKLKSSSWWNNGGNGTDEYGFAAMPGGEGGSGNLNVGYYGNWWTATECSAYEAWIQVMGYDLENVKRGSGDKSDQWFSVRCVMD